ncbi:hypothetical protein TNIN_206641 [Trichonephila inaurata madagascariensis]|uniref:Uncharacterized protein n=1 Tax=Trichonephila inaurata madagascariensis TaxID=2747483 RepID=A0A8X6WMK4_9ARAC|nr:hypothetical protein TNIN_206641 [Trichonephila inaurata madagascariensis]
MPLGVLLNRERKLEEHDFPFLEENNDFFSKTLWTGRWPKICESRRDLKGGTKTLLEASRTVHYRQQLSTKNFQRLKY